MSGENKLLSRKELLELLSEVSEHREKTGVLHPLSTVTCGTRLVLNDELQDKEAVVLAGLLYNASKEILQGLQGVINVSNDDPTLQLPSKTRKTK